MIASKEPIPKTSHSVRIPATRWRRADGCEMPNLPCQPTKRNQSTDTLSFFFSPSFSPCIGGCLPISLSCSSVSILVVVTTAVECLLEYSPPPFFLHQNPLSTIEPPNDRQLPWKRVPEPGTRCGR